MHTSHVCARDVAGTLCRCPGGTSVEPHFFPSRDVLPHAPCTHLPLGWRGQQPRTPKLRWLLLISLLGHCSRHTGL